MVEQGYQRLAALEGRIVHELRCLPGATVLYLFGSRLTDPTEPYADLDLQIITDDIIATCQVWPHFLTRIAPIRMAWPITAASDNTAFAVLFEGESLYHKVDIGLTSSTDLAGFAATVQHSRVVWEQAAPRVVVSAPSTDAYIPSVGTVGHAVMNELLGSVRYVKARKRDHQLTCWRFLRSKPDLLFQLYAEQQLNWQDDLPALNTWAYKTLDIHRDPLLNRALQHLNWATCQERDTHFLWFTNQIIELFLTKATARGERIPQDLVTDHLTFLTTELETNDQSHHECSLSHPPMS